MSGKTKNRIKKMNFQLQNRTHIPLTEEDKYHIEMASYRQLVNDEQLGRDNDIMMVFLFVFIDINIRYVHLNYNENY